MNGRDMQRIVNRICAGGFYSSIRDKEVFVDLKLSPKEKAYLDYVYDKSYSLAEKKGVDKYEERLEKNKDKNKEIDEKIEELQEELKKMKKAYLANINNNKQKGIINKKIEKTKKEADEIFASKYTITYEGTCEKFANDAYNRCKYSMIVKDLSGERLEEEFVTSPTFTNELESFLLEHRIKEGDMRYISRRNPWRLMWNNSKDPATIFGVSAGWLTDEQKELCYWSSYYDSVYEAYERPSEEIINDDIAIDAWYEAKLDESKREADKRAYEKKAKDAKEVFVVTDKDNAKKIYDLNDPHVRNAMKKRDKMIEEKGSAAEIDLVKTGGKIDAKLFIGEKGGKK